MATADAAAAGRKFYWLSAFLAVFADWRHRVRAAWRGRAKHKAAALRANALAGYVQTNAWKRNRVKLYVGLAVFATFYGFAFALLAPVLIIPLAVPLVPLALLVIWLLPEIDRPPDATLAWLMFAFMAALLCWPDYLAVVLPGLPWITAIRLIGIPLAAVMLIATSTSRSFRASVGEILTGAPMIWKLLVVFALISGMSIVWSTSVSTSISKFVIAQLYWTTIFFAAVYVFRTPGRVTRLVYLLWAITIFVCLIAVKEARDQQLPWVGHIPSFLQADGDTIGRILLGKTRAFVGAYRAQSKFTTPLGFAEFLALMMPLLIHLVMSPNKSWVRAAAAATLLLAFYAILLTDSRLGVLGALVSVILYILIWGILQWRRRPGSIIGPATMLLFPLIFLGSIGSVLFVTRVHNAVLGTGAQASSNDSRKQQLISGLPKVAARPWGYGIGMSAQTLGFRNGTGQYNGQAAPLTIDTYYLAVLLEYGIQGFLAFYGMLVAAIWYAARYGLQARDDETSFLVPCAIMLFNFFVIKAVFSQQDNHPLVFCVMGVVTALVYRERKLAKQTGVGIR